MNQATVGFTLSASKRSENVENLEKNEDIFRRLTRLGKLKTPVKLLNPSFSLKGVFLMHETKPGKTHKAMEAWRKQFVLGPDYAFCMLTCLICSNERIFEGVSFSKASLCSYEFSNVLDLTHVLNLLG